MFGSGVNGLHGLPLCGLMRCIRSKYVVSWITPDSRLIPVSQHSFPSAGLGTCSGNIQMRTPLRSTKIQRPFSLFPCSKAPGRKGNAAILCWDVWKLSKSVSSKFDVSVSHLLINPQLRSRQWLIEERNGERALTESQQSQSFH